MTTQALQRLHYWGLCLAVCGFYLAINIHSKSSAQVFCFMGNVQKHSFWISTTTYANSTLSIDHFHLHNVLVAKMSVEKFPTRSPDRRHLFIDMKAASKTATGLTWNFCLYTGRSTDYTFTMMWLQLIKSNLVMFNSRIQHTNSFFVSNIRYNHISIACCR